MKEMTKSELEAMLARAAKEGADQALKRIGLGHENAGRDMGEVLTLLAAWRLAKSTAWITIVRWVTVLFLGLMVAGVYYRVK